MFYAERKRLAELAEREAAGESFWTEDLPRPAKLRIATKWEALADRHGNDFPRTLKEILRYEGMEGPSPYPGDWVNQPDIDVCLTYLEAVWYLLSRLAPGDAEAFLQWVNQVLNQHRVAFRMVQGEVVPFSSDELHQAVVEPVMRLLVDDRFEKAHDAYLAALKEITRHEPANAITDAGTALQETLQALGCVGNRLGPLITDAKARLLLGRHDAALISGIAKFMEWASANRSQMGDSHKHSDATLSDAWLMVHVVGALILRLADDESHADASPEVGGPVV